MLLWSIFFNYLFLIALMILFDLKCLLIIPLLYGCAVRLIPYAGLRNWNVPISCF